MFRSIAMVGAGAIGGYYGVRLALTGRDVRFLFRGDLEAVRARGLELRERDATRRLAPVAAFARPEEIGPVVARRAAPRRSAPPSSAAPFISGSSRRAPARRPASA